MNNGLYGVPKAPNQLTRIAPPEWRNYQIIKSSTSTWVVPQNVYQILACVWGGGANGTTSYGGSGGGFAMGILDVTPGQRLPTITIGGSGGTSSVGSLISATGGSSHNSPGTGSVVATLRNAFTATGGNGYNGNGGGGASGSPYGSGGSAMTTVTGGAGWGGNAYGYGGAGLFDSRAGAYGGGGSLSPSGFFTGGSPYGGSPPDTEIPAVEAGGTGGFLDIPSRSLLGGGGWGKTNGCSNGSSGGGGGGCTTSITQGGNGGIGGGGGACNTSGGVGGTSSFGGGGGGAGAGTGGAGGIGGGGGGYGGSNGGVGGAGCVILYWTEGY